MESNDSPDDRPTATLYVGTRNVVALVSENGIITCIETQHSNTMFPIRVPKSAIGFIRQPVGFVTRATGSKSPKDINLKIWLFAPPVSSRFHCCRSGYTMPRCIRRVWCARACPSARELAPGRRRRATLSFPFFEAIGARISGSASSSLDMSEMPSRSVSASPARPASRTGPHASAA